jgi:hypothetical protein
MLNLIFIFIYILNLQAMGNDSLFSSFLKKLAQEEPKIVINKVPIFDFDELIITSLEKKLASADESTFNPEIYIKIDHTSVDGTSEKTPELSFKLKGLAKKSQILETHLITEAETKFKMFVFTTSLHRVCLQIPEMVSDSSKCKLSMISYEELAILRQIKSILKQKNANTDITRMLDYSRPIIIRHGREKETIFIKDGQPLLE